MHPGCSALGLVGRKVGHRGSRLLHSEFTLLSHITIPLTFLPLASGCGLHHIHCQVKHSGLLFNTPHHGSTLKPGRFDVPVMNGAAEDWSPICFHPNLSTSVSEIWEACALSLMWIVGSRYFWGYSLQYLEASRACKCRCWDSYAGRFAKRWHLNGAPLPIYPFCCV